MDLKLYLPEKYQVITGSFSNVALCTCWTEPTGIAKVYSELAQNNQLIGTLYSREGVSIMLRNLALNPWIDTVFLYGASPLSQTKIGEAGRKMLWNIWAGKTDESTQKEIDRSVLSTMAKRVKLIDASHVSLIELQKLMIKSRLKSPKAYMKRTDFPESRWDEDKPSPSEKVGFVVRGEKLVDSWAWAIDRIVRYGTVTGTKYGSKQRELQNLTWVIEGESLTCFYIPDWPENILSHVGLTKVQREDYQKTYLDKELPDGINYTYGNRLRAYQGKLDQIENIIEKINKDPAPRNAYAITTFPPADLFQSSPCLTQIQVLIGNSGEINLFCVFRSHDMGKAALLNAYGLLYLQNYIVKRTKKKIGKLTITSESAHIYEEDWQITKDIVACHIWGRVKPYFDENEDIDPRGYVRIATKRDKIYAELVTPEGEQLHEFQAPTAREIALTISKLNLLSRSDHYCDLSMELFKAELSLKLKKEYIQDRPFVIEGVVIK